MIGSTEENSSDLARQLVAEMKQELGPQQEARKSVVLTRRFRRAAIITIGALLVLDAVLVYVDRGTEGPHAPSRVVAQYQFDTCAQRQAVVLRAIAAYKKRNGHVPQTLAMLGPPDLTMPPNDPASNRPYLYTVLGDQVTIECPNPALHISGIPTG
ncbi:MAG: hypothetical protein HY270_13155 [Deltaproteobacteria bacterium]|nr:hypothetical protein [Deltaproteobacteria bacterium]